MKKVFTSPDSVQVELVKNMLSDAGIVCEVRNGDVSRIVPAPPFYEELWVAEDTYEKAADLIKSLERPTPITSTSWVCPKCGEAIEAQFSSCWKCGTPRAQVV